MTGFGTKTFTDPDDCRARLAGAEVGFVVTGRPSFDAQLSWIELSCLRLLAIQEKAPRVAFISLPAASLTISFSLASNDLLMWNGLGLHRASLVLHAPGERFHQRATGAVRWGLIAVSPQDLARYSRALLGADLPRHADGLLHPSARSSAELLRLHAQALRLAHTKPALLTRPEVARALEQDLIHALVTALGSAAPDRRSRLHSRRSAIMVRFEEALAVHDGAPSLQELCTAIGVPERTLRIYCAEFLGCGPIEYARLRRLNRARSTLLRADHDATSVAEIARSHGFLEPGRFAVTYRALFGESPLATLLRPPADSAESA
jgi:AraC-like DNA-binding protein